MNITKAKITKDNTLVASFKNENEDNVTTVSYTHLYLKRSSSLIY